MSLLSLVPSSAPDASAAPADACRSAPAAPVMLDAVRTLMLALDAASIPYCQFKSNIHLADGLVGRTDLDVLVDAEHRESLARVLADSGYKRFDSPPGGDYPGVEDYLALDSSTGRLIHLHLHHQLSTGESHLKGHRFPWERVMLATRRADRETGFPVPDPAMELLFFVTRNTLKTSAYDTLRAHAGRDPIPARLGPEFAWLLARTDAAAFKALGESLLGKSVCPALHAMIQSGPTWGSLRSLRRAAQPTLDSYRMYGRLEAWGMRLARRTASLRSKLGRRRPGLAGAVSRTDPRGGVVIALMGPDGAGKSRLTRELSAWLRWKLDARVVYFGSGDGPSSWARQPLRVMLRVAQALGWWKPGQRSATSPVRSTATAAPAGGLRGAARAVWALVLSHEKRESLRRATRARDRGMIVLCDRYPQTQVPGFNDGPLLQGWQSSTRPWLRTLAGLEAGPYHDAGRNAPRLVLKLRVSPAVAVARKPDMHTDEIQRRLDVLDALRFPAYTRVLEIDADQPWDAVLWVCKLAIWELL